MRGSTERRAADSAAPAARAPGRRLDAGLLLIAVVALAQLILHIAFHGRYGYFRDELYYIACTDRLAWGYVDHPPLSIFLLALARQVLGDSLHAIRLPAALAGAATVLLTGLMARKLGGGRRAQLLAAAAAALAPVVLANGGRYFSMNAFDLLFWALGAYVLLTIFLDGRERGWVLYGVIAGLGILNKYSMLFFGAGTLAAVLLSSRRRDFRGPWIWIGGAIAAALAMPHVAWEIRHGFPSIEFIRNAGASKNAPLSAGGFLGGQAMMMGLGQTLLWVLGIGYFLFRRSARPLRGFAWMYFLVAALMIAGNSKSYYLSPIYPPFLAAGAVLVEIIAGRPRWAWSRYAVAALVALPGLAALPFTVPVLPLDAFVRYQRALGVTPPAEERTALGVLPQHYADMFGWEELAAQVVAIYQALPPEEQQHCVIFARNYGEAGAIEFFGKRHGLPPVTCPHNSYALWAPLDRPMRVAIIIGDSYDLEDNLADLRGPDRFDEVTLAATTRCEHCMPYENGRMIFLCRGAHFTFKAIWSEEIFFI